MYGSSKATRPNFGVKKIRSYRGVEVIEVIKYQTIKRCY